MSDENALEQSEPSVPAPALSAYLADCNVVSNLLYKRFHLRKVGDKDQGQACPNSGVLFVARGAVRVTANGQSSEFSFPREIVIVKDTIYAYEALEDETLLLAIHAIRGPNGVHDVIDADSLPAGADSEYYRGLEAAGKLGDIAHPGPNYHRLKKAVK